MSWLDRLGDALAVRGIGSRDRQRILLELADHIACEPGCEARLGDPVQLAETFADELATGRARRGTWEVFGALVLTAVALVVSQLMLGRIGYPGFNHGLSPALFFPGVIGIFVAPQVALVAGTLAAIRCLRRRRAPRLAAAEIALIRRRAWIALGAGLATVAGLELHVIDFVRVLPAWWLAMTAALAAIAGLALLTAGRELRSGARVASSAAGPAGDVFDDLPLVRSRWLRRNPWRLGAAASLAAGLAFMLFEAHAEHSWVEGLQRGMFEGLAAAVGFLLLGRAIGARGSWPNGRSEPSGSMLLGTAPSASVLSEPALTGPSQEGSAQEWSAQEGSAQAPEDQLVSDEDRSHAELRLRDSFAAGRLDLDELASRLETVHHARRLADLRAALTGLPPLP